MVAGRICGVDVGFCGDPITYEWCDMERHDIVIILSESLANSKKRKPEGKQQLLMDSCGLKKRKWQRN